MVLIYDIMRVIMNVLMHIVSRPQIIGRENFPPGGPPFILATNHLSVLDLPLLLIACPYFVRALVAEKHKRNPPYAFMAIIMSAIWVRRGKVDREALRRALEVLEQGGALGIAPEGTRSRDTHALQQGKVGTAYLATRANVPIVPAGISGTDRVMGSLLRFHRTEVSVTIGKPFYLPESGRVRGKKLDEYTNLIMRRIAELVPEEYRGVYA